MKFNDFILKHNGKFVEAGGSDNALNQCVDCANAYLDEVLKLPKILGTNAIDFYKKDKTNFDWILNTPDGIPKQGDFVIWGYQPCGHIALFVEGTDKMMTVFEQNNPVGTHAHIGNHTYKNVLGWMHAKKGNMADYYKGIDLTNADSVKVCIDAWKDVVDGKYVKKEELSACQKSLKDNDEVWKERVANEKKQLDEFLRTLAEKLGTTQQEPAIIEQITRLLQVEDRVGSELEPKIKTLEERVAGVARALGVEETKIEETIKKLVKEGPTAIVEPTHSRLCGWLARKGL